MTVTAAGTGGRIAGLDLCRALLMTGGLFVHGSIWLDARPLFAWLIYLSSGTRMGVFFAIAGFLAARGLRNRPPARWCARRMAQLLPPTLSGLVVICPAIAVLHALHRGDTHGLLAEATKLHHLWFLVALCLYTLLAAATWPRLTRATERVRLSPGALLAATMLAGVAIAGAFQLALPLLPGGRAGPLWQEQRMFVHLPVFVMGMVLGRADPAAWRRAGGSILPLAVLLAVFGWRALAGDLAGAGPIADLDAIARLAVSPPAAALLVLRAATRVGQVPAWLDRAAAAALTLYLLHVPLIMVAHLALAPFGLDPHLQYAAAIAATGVAAFHLHHRLVARTPILAFLLNGVPLPSRTPRGEPLAA